MAGSHGLLVSTIFFLSLVGANLFATYGLIYHDPKGNVTDVFRRAVVIPMGIVDIALILFSYALLFTYIFNSFMIFACICQCILTTFFTLPFLIFKATYPWWSIYQQDPGQFETSFVIMIFTSVLLQSMSVVEAFMVAGITKKEEKTLVDIEKKFN